MASLVSIAVGDPVEGWTRAGFTVVDGRCHVGGMAFDLGIGPGGVDHWTLDDTDITEFEGIPTRHAALPTASTPVHPNGTIAVDHVVLATPDHARTEAAFAAIGLDCRRVRDVGSADRPMQQRFYRLGPTIAEVVGPTTPSGDGPATIWGLAFVVDDIDATARWYDAGDLGRVKDAVQAGRRIATLRHTNFAMSLPIAFMTPRETTPRAKQTT